MPLVNCEVNLNLSCSANCVLSTAANQAEKFTITNIKFYVLFVTLLTQDNAKLLQRMGLSFKTTINWNKYQSKVTIERQNQYFEKLIDPSLQGVNRIFVLSFENNDHKIYFLVTVEIKD